MVVKISQDRFDEVVQENINELGLSVEEAVSAAVEQFKAQNADLSQIVLEYLPETYTEVISKCIDDLLNKESIDEAINQLNILQEECDKGIRNRIIAGKNGAYNAILNIYHKWSNNKELVFACFKCLLSLMTKQPDLLNEKGIEIILFHLSVETDRDMQIITLKLTKECCIMHEINRQNFIAMNIVEKFKILLLNNDKNTDIIKEILHVYRALILDDDIRVEFGKAHDHAKILANESLHIIMNLINDFKSNQHFIINDLLLTLSSLLVRSEFCKQVEEANGLEMIRDVMRDFIHNDKINRQCFKLIKSLAGNDECKSHMIEKGLAPDIYNSLNFHKKSIATSIVGLQAVAAVSLRNPENSKAFYETGLPDVIVEIMKLHPNEKSIQKSASWAIRNMVSRSRYQNPYFLELGVENLLKANIRKFGDNEYDFKAALRDLECNVDFKEEWTGKGGKLTSSENKKMFQMK